MVGELGFEPIVGPELEFFLVVRDPAAPNGVRRHVDNLSMVYTVGPLADPDGLVRRMTEQLAAIGLDVFAVNHEFMNSQYEINLRHSGALDAADRAFRLKAAVKDIAAQNGLHATFMGKPFNDQGGSGTHLHLSLNRDGANAFADPSGDHGVSPEMGHFTAGLIEHAPALMALLNPTSTPTAASSPTRWPRRTPTGAGTTVRASCGSRRSAEARHASSCVSATVPRTRTSAIAAALLAGADGVRRELTPPAAGQRRRLPGRPMT